MDGRTLVLGSLVLCGLACQGEPLSKKVGAGSTITVQLVNVAPGVVIGFGSTLAGSDAQRGDVRFVLCPENRPLCSTDPTASFRGYRLQTTLVTRAELDRFSGAGLRLNRGIVSAVVDIPGSGPQRPPANVYRLEPRVLVGNVEQLAIDSSQVRTLEITQTDGVSTPLTDGSPQQLDVVRQTVPNPAVRLVQNVPQGETAAAAVELTVRYPNTRVRIVGASESQASAKAILAQMSTVDDQTVRLLLISGPSGALDLDLSFALLANATPVTASDFSVQREVLYDANGKVITGSRRFSAAQIF